MPKGTVLSVEDHFKLLVAIIRQHMDTRGVLTGVKWDQVANVLGLTRSVSQRRWSSLRQEIERMDVKKAPEKVKAGDNEGEGDAAMKKRVREREDTVEMDGDQAEDQQTTEKTSVVDMSIEYEEEV